MPTMKKAKNMKVFMIVIGFALGLGVCAYFYMWNLARHSPSIVHENEQSPE
jgi:hypothetical protein